MLNKIEVEDILKSYVSGEMTPGDFRDILYKEMNSFEEYFDQFPRLSSKDTGLLVYLLELDFDSLRGIAYSISSIDELLTRNNIPHTCITSHQELFDELFDLFPDLNPPFMKWVVTKYSHCPEWEDKKGRKKWLKLKLKDDFRSLKRPPRWIQDPNWPVTEHGPLVFVGQLDVTELHHDTSALYVFFDPATGEYQTKTSKKAPGLTNLIFE